jgi:hypothetical protein
MVASIKLEFIEVMQYKKLAFSIQFMLMKNFGK